MLSPLDKLYVVHVFKEGRKEREKEGSKWCAGGPLLPAMATALAKFPHQIVELEVRPNPLSCGLQTTHLLLLRQRLISSSKLEAFTRHQGVPGNSSGHVRSCAANTTRL